MLVPKTISKISFRYYIHSNPRIQILKDVFGFSVSEASTLVRSIIHKDPDSFLSTIKMCKELGFTPEDILSRPKVLNKNAMKLQQDFMILQEGGFEKITPHTLSQFRSLVGKKIIELKLTNYIPRGLNVAESFCKYFDPKPDNNIIDIAKFNDDSRWRHIQISVIRSYLGWRLKATEEEIEKLFRIHVYVKTRSIRLLCENISLALNLGLSLKRIRTAGYILHGHPQNTKDVLKDYSYIAGGDLKKAVLGCPKLLMITPEKYARIYGLLKKHDIPDETIKNNLNVFQYAPQTIQCRLEEIDKSPELKILRHNDRFLSLIVHHQRAKSRMCYLQELKLKCLPLKILALRNRIDNHLLSGVDMNDSGEVVSFFQTLLKTKDEKMGKELKKHPHFCAKPLYDIEETFNYLKSIKFSNDAISKVPTILLYRRDHIMEKLSEMTTDVSFKMAERQSDKLNYLLYIMEKEFNFTGEGIWPKPTEDEDC